MEDQRKKGAGLAVKVLAALAHPTRLLIVCLLLERERYVQELLAELGTTKGNISQHLRVLESQGHVVSRKESNRVYYSVPDPRLKELLRQLECLYCPGLTGAAAAPGNLARPA